MFFRKSKSKEIDVLSNLPESVMIIDENTNITWANDGAVKLFGITKAKLLKSSLNDLLDNGYQIANQSVNGSSSFIARTKCSRELFVEIRAQKVNDNLVVSARDVTSSHRTVTNILVEHESSKKVSKDKNNFLVKLSNELKSPIHSIIGFSQAMIDGLGGDMSEKQEKYVRIINKNSNELLYLVEKIIELSKSESGLFDYNFQTFDSVNAIKSILRLNEQIIKDKNLTVEFDIEELNKKAIYSDEEIFKSVIQNILETSIKATDIGSINIKLSHPDFELVKTKGLEIRDDLTENSYMLITISDTGIGLNELDLEVLFDPYSQLDKTNKKNISRSIAITSARNFVRFLKGILWVTSEPMQGTQYNLLIPIEKV